MTAALELFPTLPPRPVIGVSEAEFRTTVWGCCTNRIPLADTERALLRRTRDIPPRFCVDCGRRMALVSKPQQQTECTLCAQKIVQVPAGNIAVVIFIDNMPSFAHRECALRKGKRKITMMATALRTFDLPDCSMCGRSYEDHYRPVAGIFDAYCDTEELPDKVQYYRPATPFRSREYPNRLIVDSPYYTADGLTAYGDEGFLHA